jgi:ribosomal protein S17E
MKTKNTISVKIEQVISASGKLQEDLHLVAEFSSETTKEITNQSAGLFTYASMLKHMQVQRAQGIQTFRQNKDCTITIKVGNKEEKVTMKFSLNLERIVAQLDKFPDLLGKVFTPVPSIGSISRNDVINIAEGNKMVIAEAIKAKKIESKELPNLLS